MTRVLVLKVEKKYNWNRLFFLYKYIFVLYNLHTRGFGSLEYVYNVTFEWTRVLNKRDAKSYFILFISSS